MPSATTVIVMVMVRRGHGGLAGTVGAARYCRRLVLKVVFSKCLVVRLFIRLWGEERDGVVAPRAMACQAGCTR